MGEQIIEHLYIGQLKCDDELIQKGTRVTIIISSERSQPKEEYVFYDSIYIKLWKVQIPSVMKIRLKFF